MSQLTDLLEAVKDQHLGKIALEQYDQEMTHLHSAMQLELANVEKAGALFFEATKEADGDVSDISIKRKWKASMHGQREIELNRFIKTVALELKSLKNRLYNLY